MKHEVINTFCNSWPEVVDETWQRDNNETVISFTILYFKYPNW